VYISFFTWWYIYVLHRDVAGRFGGDRVRRAGFNAVQAGTRPHSV
jgi:hypothetical protein